MRLFLYILLFALVGCASVQIYEDVSKDSQYQSLIGQEYRLVKPMYLVGIDLPPGYSKDVEIYFVQEYSGSGPEDVISYSLEEGLRFVINSVQRCTNCTFGLSKLIKLSIDLKEYTVEQDVPIYFLDNFFNQEYVIKVE